MAAANVIVNIPQLLQAAFGFVALPQAITAAASTLVRLPGGIRIVEQGTVIDRSYLGTPVVDIIKLRKNADDEGITLPLTSVITYRKRKRFVYTNINGRDGAVKEYINKEDPVVTIRGVIIPGSSRQAMLDAMADIDDYYNHVGTLMVESEFLSTLGFTSAVFSDLDYSGKAGYTSSQPFTIELIYDNPDEYNALANDFLLAEINVPQT